MTFLLSWEAWVEDLDIFALFLDVTFCRSVSSENGCCVTLAGTTGCCNSEIMSTSVGHYLFSKWTSATYLQLWKPVLALAFLLPSQQAQNSALS